MRCCEDVTARCSGAASTGPDSFTPRDTLLMRHVVFVPLLVTLVACQFSENRYLKRTVRPEELVGNWQATEFAISSLRYIGVREHLTVSDHTLVLRADGSCSIQMIMNIGQSSPDLRSYGTGCRWRLADLTHQALMFDLDPEPPVGPPHYYRASAWRGR